MNPVGSAATVEEYRDFGERQTADSPCFRDWALGVAGDPEVLALLDTLPPPMGGEVSRSLDTVSSKRAR